MFHLAHRSRISATPAWYCASVGTQNCLTDPCSMLSICSPWKGTLIQRPPLCMPSHSMLIVILLGLVFCCGAVASQGTASRLGLRIGPLAYAVSSSLTHCTTSPVRLIA